MDPNTYPNFTSDDAGSIPLQYIGYRAFSQWVATDQSFFVVRKFGALGARVALSLQDEVTQLEARLNDLDRLASWKDEKAGSSPTFVNNGTFRDDPMTDRSRLIKHEISDTLSRYYSFLNQYSQLVVRPTPEPEAVQNIRSWFDNHDIKFKDGTRMAAIDDLEAAYIREPRYTSDLVPVQPKNLSPIRRFLGNPNVQRVWIMRKMFGKRIKDWEKIDPTDQGPGSEGGTMWTDDKAIDTAAEIMTAISCLCMLTGPLWILDYVDGIHQRLGVITGFVAILFILVRLATTAKMSDAIAAAAAYAAVLTVFLTLSSGST